MRISHLILMAVAATGCAEADGAGGGAARDPDVVDVLTRSLTASVGPGRDGAGSAATIDSVVDDQIHPLDLAVTGGTVAVRLAGDLLILSELSVEVADLELPASLIPDAGARLTGVALELRSATAGAVTVAEHDEVVVELAAPAVIHWTMIKDGVEVTLADLELDRLALGVAVSAVGGDLVVRISGGQTGPLWSWLDHFGLEDLELSLVASTPAE